MIYKDLKRLIDYQIPIIEILNEYGETEYIINLDNLDFKDIIILNDDKNQYYGKVVLQYKEYEKPKTYFITKID
jgi:hypothetical protein